MNKKQIRRKVRYLGRFLRRELRDFRYEYDDPDQFSIKERKRLTRRDATRSVVGCVENVGKKRNKTDRLFMRFDRLSSRPYWKRKGSLNKFFSLHPTARHRKYWMYVSDDEFDPVPF